ncbi:MAG TPA: hypothetical protein VN648_19395, partial [Candidatus Methylomirabilis sp.]|nr:hypothetical protein [Candidatus Methylomirabilis sp.]
PATETSTVEPLIAVSSTPRGELHGMTGVISRILGMRLHVQRPHGEVSTPRLPVVESVTAPTGLARR